MKTLLKIASILALFASLTSGQAALKYHVTAITPGSGEGINNKGDVTGEMAIYTDFWTYFRGGHAFLYKNSKLMDLGVYYTPLQPVYETMTGNAVNNSDVVVGAIDNYGGPLGGTSTAIGDAFMWQNGQTKVIAIGSGNGGNYAYATAINERGDTVGVLDILSLPPRHSYGAGQAFLYRNGIVTPLGVLNSAETDPFKTYSIANDINNAGQIVGVSSNVGGYAGFLWSNGKMRSIGTFSPNAINDSGWIAGTNTLFSPVAGATAAVLYVNGRLINLGTLPGYLGSEGVSLNNSGVVVGDLLGNITTTSTGSDGTVYTNTYVGSTGVFVYNGRMQNLNGLVDGGWTITAVGHINDFGQMAATGTKAGSTTTYALLLTPAL
jgi:probable HAF family extracellular repeat protein